jgi:precorrin-2 dehydrogenase / sirohydrochlorin ferrochelatase
MMTNYPILLQLRGKRVVVVGGGKVAERKVSGLIETGAAINVISPEATDVIQSLASEGKISWQHRPFMKGDLKDAFLIFAATNDKENNQLVKNSSGAHQLVSIADDPEGSVFHVPANFKRGRLVISVSTGGASPILSSQIREQLERQFDESYECYLEFLFTARQRILQEVKDPLLKRKLLTAIVSQDFLTSENREADFQRLMDENI